MKLSLKMWKTPVYQLEYMHNCEKFRKDLEDYRKEVEAFRKDLEDYRKEVEAFRKYLEKFKKSCVTAFLEASS